jgi:hypothetical protein
VKWFLFIFIYSHDNAKEVLKAMATFHAQVLLFFLPFMKLGGFVWVEVGDDVREMMWERWCERDDVRDDVREMMWERWCERDDVREMMWERCERDDVREMMWERWCERDDVRDMMW